MMIPNQRGIIGRRTDIEDFPSLIKSLDLQITQLKGRLKVRFRLQRMLQLPGPGVPVFGLDRFGTRRWRERKFHSPSRIA